MSANKAERVIEIDQICGRLYEERRMRLELMPYRVGYPIFKLVYYCEKIKTSSSRA